jgi:hypothetical protein
MFCLVNCLTLKMGASISSQKSVNTYQPTRLNITGDLNLHLHFYDHLRSRENYYLHIPSSSRCLPRPSVQRHFYYASYALRYTRVIHAAQLVPRPHTFPVVFFPGRQRTHEASSCRPLFFMPRGRRPRQKKTRGRGSW